MRTPTEAAWDSPDSHIGRASTEHHDLSWLNSLTIAGVAQKLQREIPYGIILDQYGNVRNFCMSSDTQLTLFCFSFLKINNPLAHERTTGPEIIDAVVSTLSTPSKPSSEKVDVFIGGAGTGGTISGVSRAMKAHNPKCIVVGIDPVSRCMT